MNAKTESRHTSTRTSPICLRVDCRASARSANLDHGQMLPSRVTTHDQLDTGTTPSATGHDRRGATCSLRQVLEQKGIQSAKANRPREEES
jgi:hypothetical protein